MYARPFFTVVSFVLFLIALTFPIHATQQQVTQYNRWLYLLFDVLPLDPSCKRAFQALHTKPITRRSEFVDFVFAMHASILKTDLNRTQTLLLFDQLRATDCGTQSATDQGTAKETGCKHTQRTNENVCLVFFHSDVDSSVFTMDERLRVAKNRTLDVFEDAMTNTDAFCSCLFSAKWFMLHMIASEFPREPTEAQKENYKDWLLLFGELLACFACRVNFRDNVTKIGLDIQHDFASRYAFEMFMYRLHSVVNDMLHQPNISFADMKLLYSHLQTTIRDDHFATIAITYKENTCRFFDVTTTHLSSK